MKKCISLVLCFLFLMSMVACGAAPSSTTSLSTPVSSQPEPEPEPLNQAYLTGLEKDLDYPEGKRVAGVMVNNLAGARPQRGLSEAQILIESQVEGQITRFMAIYEDYENMPVVGPVRSARDQFFQMLLPMWGFYIHDGPSQNQPVNWMLRDYDYDEFNLDTGKYGSSTTDPTNLNSLAWRDADRRAAGRDLDQTEYTDGEHVQALVEREDLDGDRTYGSPIFNYVPYNEPRRVLEGGDAKEVGIVLTQSYRTMFYYNDSLEKYEMSQYNSGRGVEEETIDENNGKRVAFDNVFVLFAPMSGYEGTGDKGWLKKFNLGEISIGYYFCDGRYELIRWTKNAPDSLLVLWVNDTTETSLQVNPGTSYIALVDNTQLEPFYNSMLAGTGTEDAADGEVTSNEQDTVD